jgi:hypothetical protein
LVLTTSGDTIITHVSMYGVMWYAYWKRCRNYTKRNDSS